MTPEKELDMTEQPTTDPLTDVIRGALINVLMNTSNYPPAAQAHMLGKDNGVLLNRATEAVEAVVRASGTTTSERVPRTCTACGTPEGADHNETRDHTGYAWQINRPAASPTTLGGVTREQRDALARDLYVAVYGSRAAEQFPDAVQRVGGRLVDLAVLALRPVPAPDDRCQDRTQTPRGPVRCPLPAGHDADPLSLHVVPLGAAPDDQQGEVDGLIAQRNIALDAFEQAVADRDATRADLAALREGVQRLIDEGAPIPWGAGLIVDKADLRALLDAHPDAREGA